MTDGRDFEFIAASDELEHACAELAGDAVCAVDTEFMRESTYYPELALIQLASESRLVCIDPLALDDLSPLAALFADAGVVKVFHSPSQDLEILYQKFGSVPAPLFDTQLAAAVLGYNHQVSYAELVRDVLGVSLEKKHTRANWVRRPLSADELDYAMDDVRYLLPLYAEMRARLEAGDRLAWIERDLAELERAENYAVDFDHLWQRLKGVQKLKGEKLWIASELCRWREQLAQRQNRPRRWIVKDEALVEIARRKPADAAALMQVPDLPDKTARRHGDELLRIVRAATRVDPQDYPRHDRAVRLGDAELALGDCLMGLCRAIAADNGVALATLATRKDIDKLITNRRSSRLLQGWRYAMAGETLLAFMHGQARIGVADGAIELLAKSTGDQPED